MVHRRRKTGAAVAPVDEFVAAFMHDYHFGAIDDPDIVELIRQRDAAVRRATLEEVAQLIEAQGSQPNTITTPDSEVTLSFYGLYPTGPHAMMAAEIRALLAQEKADG